MLDSFASKRSLISETSLSFKLSLSKISLCLSNFSIMKGPKFLKKRLIINKVFYGRVQLEAATALFYFHKKGRVQRLLHNLKYKGKEELGRVFGNWLGAELQESSYFNAIDVVIPVPIHPTKLKQRGYNQVALFAQQLAYVLKASYVDDVLLKSINTKTQVLQSKEARYQSVAHSFRAKNLTAINDKHVLLVDDIITTGATIEACALVLSPANKCRLSVATIAITHSIFR